MSGLRPGHGFKARGSTRQQRRLSRLRQCLRADEHRPHYEQELQRRRGRPNSAERSRLRRRSQPASKLPKSPRSEHYGLMDKGQQQQLQAQFHDKDVHARRCTLPRSTRTKFVKASVNTGISIGGEFRGLPNSKPRSSRAPTTLGDPIQELVCGRHGTEPRAHIPRTQFTHRCPCDPRVPPGQGPSLATQPRAGNTAGPSTITAICCRGALPSRHDSRTRIGIPTCSPNWAEATSMARWKTPIETSRRQSNEPNANRHLSSCDSCCHNCGPCWKAHQ